MFNYFAEHKQTIDELNYFCKDKRLPQALPPTLIRAPPPRRHV